MQGMVAHPKMSEKPDRIAQPNSKSMHRTMVRDLRMIRVGTATVS